MSALSKVLHSSGVGIGVPPTVALGLFTGGTIQNFAPATGVLNNVNPGGAWPSTGIGRIDVDTSAGSTRWTGLVAVSDADGILITNKGPNLLQLDNQSVLSLAANRFFASDDMILYPGQGVIAVYNGTAGLWYIR